MLNQETENLLMQFAYRIADHLEIKGMDNVTFFERERLLDFIMETDLEAWGTVYEYFEAQIEREAVRYDDKAKSESLFYWQQRDVAASERLTTAGKMLITYFLNNKIPIEDLLTKDYDPKHK